MDDDALMDERAWEEEGLVLPGNPEAAAAVIVRFSLADMAALRDRAAVFGIPVAEYVRQAAMAALDTDPVAQILAR